MSHTPGPWEKIADVDHTNSPELFVREKPDASGCARVIVWWDKPYPDNVDCDNARLIAAAPDLLAACKDAVRECTRCDKSHPGLIWTDDCDGGHHETCPACSTARTAIGKASG